MSNKKQVREMPEGRGIVTVARPVAVHRWFATGEGWVYSSGSAGVFEAEEIKRVLSRRDPARDGESGLLRDSKGYLLYYLEPDRNPADPKAAGRSPSILRIVVLPREPRAQFVPSLIAQLRKMTLPDHPGELPDLVLDVPEDWLSTPSPLARSSGQANRQHSKWVFSRRFWLMGGIFTAGIIVVATSLLVVARDSFSVSAVSVYERLLKPLDVRLDNTTSAVEVANGLAEVYCKKGMIQHYFPNKNPEDIVSLIKNERSESTIATFGSSLVPSNTDGSLHPDLAFAHDVGEPFLEKFAKAIRWLPDSPLGSSKGILLGNKLAREVNEIATHIPRDEREGAFPQRPVLQLSGNFGVELLQKVVVENLKDLKPIDVEGYVQWFTKWSWEPNGSFPWDAEPDERTRTIALLFTLDQDYPEDERQTAAKMVSLLRNWGVKGVREDDAKRRPWFVGRCFVEFLSLKHLGLTKEERESLDKADTFIWHCLQKLPNEGWMAVTNEQVSAEQMWQMTRKRIKELAGRLDIGDESDAATVESIGKKINNWKDDLIRIHPSVEEKLERIRSLAKEIKECDIRLSELDSATQKEEYAKIEQEKDKLRREQKELQSELQRFENTGNKYCDDFWNRLTGSNGSIGEGRDR